MRSSTDPFAIPTISAPPASEQFLSEDDLDLQNLTWNELLAEWDAWLQAASRTDDEDADLYSHGVFRREPRADTQSAGRVCGSTPLP